MNRLELTGLTTRPSQVWGGVRLVPLVREEPVVACIDCADDGPAFARSWSAPADREPSGRAVPGMRCQTDMTVSVSGHDLAPQKQKALSSGCRASGFKDR